MLLFYFLLLLILSVNYESQSYLLHTVPVRRVKQRTKSTWDSGPPSINVLLLLLDCALPMCFWLLHLGKDAQQWFLSGLYVMIIWIYCFNFYLKNSNVIAHLSKIFLWSHNFKNIIFCQQNIAVSLVGRKSVLNLAEREAFNKSTPSLLRSNFADNLCKDCLDANKMSYVVLWIDGIKLVRHTLNWYIYGYFFWNVIVLFTF